jgi:hypothetical protein
MQTLAGSNRPGIGTSKANLIGQSLLASYTAQAKYMGRERTGNLASLDHARHFSRTQPSPGTSRGNQRAVDAARQDLRRRGSIGDQVRP